MEKAFACVLPARRLPESCPMGAPAKKPPLSYTPSPLCRNEQSTSQLAALRREMEAGVAPGPHKTRDSLKTLLAGHGIEPSQSLVHALEVWKGL